MWKIAARVIRQNRLVFAFEKTYAVVGENQETWLTTENEQNRLQGDMALDRESKVLIYTQVLSKNKCSNKVPMTPWKRMCEQGVVNVQRHLAFGCGRRVRRAPASGPSGHSSTDGNGRSEENPCRSGSRSAPKSKLRPRSAYDWSTIFRPVCILLFMIFM